MKFKELRRVITGIDGTGKSYVAIDGPGAGIIEEGGAGLAPLPGPGVYADHDAVDTPALLPDGSPAPTSVPEYLQVSAARPHTDEVDREIESGQTP